MLGADTYNKAHTDRYEAQLKAEKLLDDYIQQVKSLNIPDVIKSLSDLDGKTIPVRFTVTKGQPNIYIDDI